MNSNSKKHWPSMFIKPKSSTSSGNQLPETSDSSVMRVPRSGLGESSHNYALERERSQPKPRPRWHPKQEQLRILEAIFQSGKVSVEGEEIKRIRAQLQVFGPVEDVNVFYWFQNRRSRSKRRPRLPPTRRSKSRTDSGPLSSTSSTSTSASVHSKYITEISNSPSNSMHSIIGDQYCSSSAVPVSSFAGNHYDLDAVYEEMMKTSTFAPSETITDLSNNAPNSMHSNIGDQYCSSSAVPVSSFAGNHYDLDAVYEEMMRTSTFAPSETIADLPNNAPNSMYSNIGDQYCSSSAVPVSSFAGNHYDAHAVYKEMNKTTTFAPSETIAGLSNIPPDFMHGIIADQYCSSSAVAVSSSAGHHYDVQTVCEEMNNYNELSNMQVLGAAAAGGGQRMLNEGTAGVQPGSIINTNPLITVFINDVPQAIPSGPINLRDFFGDDAFLFDSTGESVLVNEFGFTCLEHGATYFLI